MIENKDMKHEYQREALRAYKQHRFVTTWAESTVVVQMACLKCSTWRRKCRMCTLIGKCGGADDLIR